MTSCLLCRVCALMPCIQYSFLFVVVVVVVVVGNFKKKSCTLVLTNQAVALIDKYN